jgi:redox-sensitive bicupin YhaK (pirin superfamily)
MKNFRSVRSTVYAPMMDMGGFPVRQALPSPGVEQLDPFLLLHHADIKVPAHIPVSQSGVGPHPHRGFSPVTFIYKGGVQHRDSRGNNNIVYEGGIQWMNAGMGIVHSERPPKDIGELGGRQEIIQLWVNTPARHKMDQPLYFPLTREQIPVILSPDGQVRIQIVSGELEGVKGKIPLFSPVNTFSIEMKKNGEYFFPVPVSHNAFIYLLDGEIQTGGETSAEGKNLVIFNQDGEGIQLRAKEDTRLLLGTGEALHEPVASHGPFVMNNETELLEAFRDYKLGKMGVLIEE